MFNWTNRAVFKWLSKVITWLRLLRFVIGLKDSRQFFNQWESKPKPFAPRTRDFSRASSELQVIARDCDWFMALFIPVVIGWSNCFGFRFSTVIWKPFYNGYHRWQRFYYLFVIFIPIIGLFLTLKTSCLLRNSSRRRTYQKSQCRRPSEFCSKRMKYKDY